MEENKILFRLGKPSLIALFEHGTSFWIVSERIYQSHASPLENIDQCPETIE